MALPSVCIADTLPSSVRLWGLPILLLLLVIIAIGASSIALLFGRSIWLCLPPANPSSCLTSATSDRC